MLRGCRGWVSERIIQRIDLGDHVGMLVQVTEGESRRPTERPLGFDRLRELEPGHGA